MKGHRARARRPRDATRPPPRLTAPGDVEPYLHDEAHFPGGHTTTVLLPSSEGEVAWALANAPSVLPSGARSSLTGGATPFGDWVVSLERMDGLSVSGTGPVRAGAGLTLLALQQALEPKDLWYPPIPTFAGAMVGGTVATNAAGAATFKYGSTRDWVTGLTVMLACGEVLEIERNTVRADLGGSFEIETTTGPLRVQIPAYRMPAVAKRSAGYHSEPGMDLVDLFIGSEGTLGVVLEARLKVAALDFSRVALFAPLPGEAAALELARELRAQARRGADGIDVAAIEFFDGRSLELLREDGADKAQGILLEPADRAALLVQIEVRPQVDPLAAMDEAAGFDDPLAPSTPIVRLCRLASRYAEPARMQVALPGASSRAGQLFALREAVPVAVNRRVGEAQRAIHPAIQKVAADMVVPFERLGEMLEIYHALFAQRGLDHAIWGHISDGNLHPNLLPRSIGDVEGGKEVILQFGRHAAKLGGCPLSEHGVGRSPIKQELLRQLYGDEGISQMRAVKRALDPDSKLSPGVIFPAET